ncbi:type 11 methyltransferase [Opitutaceae bacterium TAV5]|nr:type 11 methyltransferase [Opitutaceae bacterium TAV5]
MSSSPPDFSANIERFTGFADHYDRFRPSPPAVLADLLGQLARLGTAKPARVVDIGCGTGLSTRYWAGRATEIIGVEPTDAMRTQAESHGGEGIVYRKGFSHATGLPDACADIVTCSQALHWMDPLPTFREVARILKPGGVFAAFDYDWPPVTTSWVADKTYTETVKAVGRLEGPHGINDGLHRWDKAGHLGRMQESGAFAWVRECTVQHTDEGNADRLVGLLLSQGSVQSLRKKRVAEIDRLADHLHEVAIRELGSGLQRWFWSSRIRIGIRASE